MASRKPRKIRSFCTPGFAGVAPRVARNLPLLVGSAEAACDAAYAGIGITIAFAYHFQTALKCGALTTLLDEFQPATLPGQFVHSQPVSADQSARFPQFCSAAAKASLRGVGKPSICREGL
jgi:DNA-binding transcriptional LysR family regulator